MTKFTIVRGKKYRAINDAVVEIVKEVAPGTPDYNDGYRFIDSDGNLYTDHGKRHATSNLPHELDLQCLLDDDYVETIETETVCEQYGFFRILRDKVRRNPVKTTVGIGAVAGASAYGGYNYRRYGTVMPPRSRLDNRDAREVAAAAASFFIGR